MKHYIELDWSDIIRESVTLSVEVKFVKGRRAFIRLKMAILICRLAAFIGGINLEVNEKVGVILKDLEE